MAICMYLLTDARVQLNCISVHEFNKCERLRVCEYMSMCWLKSKANFLFEWSAYAIETKYKKALDYQEIEHNQQKTPKIYIFLYSINAR